MRSGDGRGSNAFNALSAPELYLDGIAPRSCPMFQICLVSTTASIMSSENGLPLFGVMLQGAMI